MTLKSLLMLVLAGILVATPVAAKDKLPETTKDGLVLQKDSEVYAVYLEPGATLEPYTKIMLVAPYVAFKKDWQQDFNRSRISVSDKVSDKDMERIKSDVASEFTKVFTETLQDDGYEVVDETGSDVMIIRPAIINLVVNAPDLNKAGMHADIVRSAGALTLYIELYDSVTSDKFAEVLDGQQLGNRGFGYRSSKVTNKQALDQTLRHWSGLLVNALDAAHGKSE